MKQLYPSTKQANLLFLLVSILILIGSSILAPRLGLGTNLWVNELLWILAPTVLLVKFGKMSDTEVFKLQKTSKNNIMLGVLAAISMWFLTFFLSKVTGMFLDSKFGAFNTGNAVKAPSANQAVLMLIGMLILAPICEELLFRGVIQSAYEAWIGKYGFIVSAALFGMFHVMNGITEVLPTFLLGLMLGFIVYRTRSIIASMFAHFAVNFSALFINGSLRLSFLKEIPLWLYFVSFGGLFLAIFLLSRLKPAAPEVTETPEKSKYPLGSAILFALSGLFVICIGALEIYARTKL